MRYKNFILGDVHGDYDAMINGLAKAGYNCGDSSHRIISLGDNFGRASTGLKSKGVWKYLTNQMPEYQHVNAPICIRGNHESILLDVFRRGYLTQTDIYNGEAQTISSFAHCSKSEAIFDHEMVQKAARTGVEEWIHNMPWYYETKNYIFVHGFLPAYDEEWGDWSAYNDEDWHDASWTNTIEDISSFKQSYPLGWKKTIVFGHWTSADFYSYFDRKYDYYGHIYRNDQLRIIACDCTTALTHNIEVLVVEDEEEDHE